MKIVCPTCGKKVPVTDIALDTSMAKCIGCNEVFSFADEVATEPIPERPFDAHTKVLRTPQELLVISPRHGLGASTVVMAGFAVVWLSFICFWTIGALAGGGGLFAAFSIPFWLIGFGLMLAAVWGVWGQQAILIDRAQLVAEMRCLLFRRVRGMSRANVQAARAMELPASSDSRSAPNVVEIVTTKRTRRIPCSSAAETRWLIAEINGFLESVPHDASFASMESPSEAIRRALAN